MKGSEYKVVFTGDFWEYFWMTIRMAVLTIVTIGLAAPYAMYRTQIYFLENLKVEPWENPNGKTKRRNTD